MGDDSYNLAVPKGAITLNMYMWRWWA